MRRTAPAHRPPPAAGRPAPRPVPAPPAAAAPDAGRRALLGAGVAAFVAIVSPIAPAVADVAVAVAAAVAPPPPPPPRSLRALAQPFLTKTGARGLLAEEEERLYRLRLQKEAEVVKELDRARAELLADEAFPGRTGQLCATPFGVDVVGITTAVGLIGAAVGGFSARARKDEVEALNNQLRKINMSLRQQARAGTVYAPGLNYAPQPLGGGGGGGGATATAVAPAPAALAPPPPPAPAASTTLDEDDAGPELRACVAALREGKRLLKAGEGPPALVRFEKALMLAEAIGDTIHEKRAVRGLAAASRLNGDRRSAIKHLERVLALSRATRDHVGDADAFGTIADLYTELGAFEKAAEYYDRYISRMATDGPV